MWPGTSATIGALVVAGVVLAMGVGAALLWAVTCCSALAPLGKFALAVPDEMNTSLALGVVRCSAALPVAEVVDEGAREGLGIVGMVAVVGGSTC